MKEGRSRRYCSLLNVDDLSKLDSTHFLWTCYSLPELKSLQSKKGKRTCIAEMVICSLAKLKMLKRMKKAS